ncbi:TetR/AcrR family transcriptional regulator [Pleomorphomonas carboxyditropha]|uniref:TetR family transcriptional regulator n=1 Tax=Pleomorphomonas carboxyditropha TaxID=2023338 RepID=A0A2G9WQE3_9HYPH|nr:TetR/AcrR family transcriptional regulator [Pleomorphomonas carboxyditropha]PIO96926.1 TetR family transcriptional regulator [Pleomorphomonas carboxyditropha]
MGRHREFDPERALEAALVVFWRKGYEGTSFEDLTQATGVARPGLYAAFGNKEALFLKVLDRYEATYVAFMREALGEPHARDVVRRILEGNAIVHTLDGESRGCLGINGAMACSDEGEPVRQELVRRRAASEAALRDRLERARREGDLPADADSTVLAAYVMTIGQGMAVQAKAGAPRQKLDAIAAHVLATWPTGLPAASSERAGTR